MPAAEALVERARRALGAGDLGAAERACRAILAERPDDGRAWSVLCETALQRNRLDAALVAGAKAVALAPGDPFAHVMRAKSLMLAGERREALEAAEAGARIADLPPRAADGLGAILSWLGRPAEALGLFRRAVEAAPENARFRYNRAAALRMTGALEEAEADCDRLIARHPDHHPAWSLRADLRVQTPERNHVAALQSLLAAGIRPWQGEVLIRYALGKEWEDLGEHGHAFRQIEAGAELYRRHIRHDGQAEIAAIDAVIRRHTREALAALPPGDAGDAPIFIVGLPRSGTTLVERIVAGHGAVNSAGELGAFPAGMARLPDAGLPADPAALGRAYLEAARATGPAPPRRFIDKLPQNFLHCGAIHAALPRARIILLRRHPMASCYALFKAHFAGTQLYSYDLDALGAYFLAFRRLARHWQATLPAAALIEVAYEDVVADLAGQSRRILAFLDLPWEDAVLRFHESRAPAATASAVQVRRPLYATSVGAWRHHAAELAPLRARLATEIPAAELA